MMDGKRWFWRCYNSAGNLARWLYSSPRGLLFPVKTARMLPEEQRLHEDLCRRHPIRTVDADGITMGILKGFTDAFRKYVLACEEMGVAYKVLDLTKTDWLRDVRESRCDGFITHPTYYMQPWKQMFEERLRIISRDLQLPIHPGERELWLYESKRRMAYWLEAHEVPHAPTRVFYQRDAAFTFAAAADYPVVCKTDLGSSASGVTLVRSVGQAYRMIARAFGPGLKGQGRDPRDREWGSILFQKYIPGAREFRVLQVGESWFGLEKFPIRPSAAIGKASARSGSAIPPEPVFDFCLNVSRKGKFNVMDYDVFLCPDGDCLMNEMQAMFNASRLPYLMCREDGVTGRMLHNGRSWRFEEGFFNRNAGANVRVASFIAEIRRHQENGRKHSDRSAVASQTVCTS